VTHVKKLAGGGLELGGRRFAGARTKTVGVEDVAALYQAHRRLAEASLAVDRRLQAASQPLINAFNALMNLYLQNVRRYDQDKNAIFDGLRFGQAVAAVEQYLGSALSETTGRSPLDTDGQFRLLEGLRYKDINAQHQLMQALKPRAQGRVEELERQRYGELLLAGQVPADEPGFSLDPQWDAPSLIRDLTQLLTDPAVIIHASLKIADETYRQVIDASVPRRTVVTAWAVEDAFLGFKPEVYKIPDKWRQRIKAIIASVHGKSGRQVEKGAIVPFLKLKKELEGADKEEAHQLLAILDHLASLHRAQCARYDGPLQGTRVGMNLFYTDILAKLWASLDYYREAPIDEVYGFRSSPIDGPDLEVHYWAENWALPSTRLWFGPKGDAYKGEPGAAGGLNFAHISTRVYSAGSDPLNPGAETTPAERSRRIFGWWDRHFAKVADYEQAYHVQNQIMKWSVITGWMAKHNLLRKLEEISVDRSHRFDRWYAASHDLKFRRAIAFLPEDRWLGGTECVEILRSYSYPSAGYPKTFTEGGVSLGSSKSLKTASQIQEEIPLQLRRGGLDYSVSKPGKLSELKLANLKKTTFEFPPPQVDRVAVKASIPERARLRVGPTEMVAKRLTTEVVLRDGGGRIALETERGALGELHLGRTGDRVHLVWRDGGVEADRVVLEDVRDLFGKGESATPKLATYEQFCLIVVCSSSSGKVRV
jgi:hypothetical protein